MVTEGNTMVIRNYYAVGCFDWAARIKELIAKIKADDCKLGWHNPHKMPISNKHHSKRIDVQTRNKLPRKIRRD
jgi:hypothetical protein